MEALIGLAILVAIPFAYFKLKDRVDAAIARGLDRADEASERRRAVQRAAEAADPSRTPGRLTRTVRWIDKKLDQL
jgi:hypothetical protein